MFIYIYTVYRLEKYIYKYMCWLSRWCSFVESRVVFEMAGDFDTKNKKVDR